MHSNAVLVRVKYGLWLIHLCLLEFILCSDLRYEFRSVEYRCMSMLSPVIVRGRVVLCGCFFKREDQRRFFK